MQSSHQIRRFSSPHLRPPAVAEFGDFQFSTAPLALRRNGEEKSVPAQPGLCLELLVRRAGDTVTREEIRSELWPDEHHVAWEQGINHVIRTLRALLGDNARQPSFIETIPRRGYRFVAPVSWHTPAEVAAGSVTEPLPGTHDTPNGLDSGAREKPVNRWRLAASSAGMALALTWLAVSGAGNFRAIGAPQTGHGKSAQSTTESAFGAELPAEASSAFLEGQHLLGRQSFLATPTWRPDRLDRAIQAFEEAVEHLPSFTAAHAHLASALLARQGRQTAPDAALAQRARSAAARALALGDDPRARVVLAILDAREERDLHSAARHLRQAIRLSPTDPNAYELLATVSLAHGKMEEARRFRLRAMHLQPSHLPDHLFHLANLEYRRGRSRLALGHLDRLFELDPNHLSGRWLALRLHLDGGDDHQALAMANEQLRILGEPPVESLGDFWSDRDTYMTWLLEQGTNSGVDLAWSAWYNGRPEKALEYLVEACQAGSSWGPVLAPRDPITRRLLAEPGAGHLLACFRDRYGPSLLPGEEERSWLSPLATLRRPDWPRYRLHSRRDPS